MAILGKTEGNGCVNDFTRGFASRALKDLLRRHCRPSRRTRSASSCRAARKGRSRPHIVVFERRDVDGPPERGALALGRARTADLPYEHLGRLEQVDLVAGARRARRCATRESPTSDDVHFVQVKCPLLTRERVAEVEARGRAAATRDTLKSMALSRAASSLGIGVALGEIDRARLTDEAIGRDWRLFSSRASASAGVELTDHEIVVLGAAPGWRGPLRIAHGVMGDSIDVEPVRAALASLGLASPGQLAAPDRSRVVALLAKAEASSTGRLRGRRHTMLDDFDISATRHARSFVAGALAGLIGHAELYVSGGAEHQGPDGGGPVAIIAAEAGRHPMSAAEVLSPDRHDNGPVAGDDRHDQDLRLAGRARQRVDQGAGGHLSRASRGERRGQIDAGQVHHGLLHPRSRHADARRTAGRGRAIRATPRRSGVGMVYQHFTLVPSLTAAENLVASRADAPAIINWRKERRALEAFLDRMPFRVPLDRPVSSLAAGEKQKLEILKLLYLDQRFLILDEPTSVLTPGEADEILGLLRDMAHRGEITGAMITHKFREVEAFCDDVERAAARRQGRRRQGRRAVDARNGGDDDRRRRGAPVGGRASRRPRAEPSWRSPACSSRTTKAATRSTAST